MRFIKQQIKQSQIYDMILQVRRYREFWQWKRRGLSIPVPHIIKQRTVREYAKRFHLDTLVETGTYKGEMIYATRKSFQRIFSVELDLTLYEQAKQKFISNHHITILHGDSATMLPEILAEINTPSLFWLDAHFSGGITAKGDINTPIIQELQLILNHPIKTHVILIDDAREFVGQNDYPQLDMLESMLSKRHSGWVFENKDDMCRIHKLT